MTSDDELSMTPFPKLTWDDFFWVGEMTIPAWAGFQQRLGAYSSVTDSQPSTGLVKVSVRPPNAGSGPTVEQQNAMNYLLENQQFLRDKIVQAVFDIYPDLRKMFRFGYGYSDSMSAEEKARFEEEFGELVPELSSPEQLGELIGLSQIHIQDETKNGFALVGFEFGCNWDEEHGLGVMTAQDEIIEIGAAEVAFC